MKFNIYYIDCWQGKENLGGVNRDGEISKNGEFAKFYSLENAKKFADNLSENCPYKCVYKPSLYEADIEEYDTEQRKVALILELLWELNHG